MYHGLDSQQILGRAIILKLVININVKAGWLHFKGLNVRAKVMPGARLFRFWLAINVTSLIIAYCLSGAHRTNPMLQHCVMAQNQKKWPVKLYNWWYMASTVWRFSEYRNRS